MMYVRTHAKEVQLAAVNGSAHAAQDFLTKSRHAKVVKFMSKVIQFRGWCCCSTTTATA